MYFIINVTWTLWWAYIFQEIVV